MFLTACRLLRETYEPEQLTPASTLEADPQGNAVVEVSLTPSSHPLASCQGYNKEDTCMLVAKCCCQIPGAAQGINRAKVRSS